MKGLLFCEIGSMRGIMGTLGSLRGMGFLIAGRQRRRGRWVRYYRRMRLSSFGEEHTVGRCRGYQIKCCELMEGTKPVVSVN